MLELQLESVLADRQCGFCKRFKNCGEGLKFVVIVVKASVRRDFGRNSCTTW